MTLIETRLLAIQDETPTVKRFLFDVRHQGFVFRPGQWVDFYVRIQGQQNVAGYSIVSAPIHEQETLELAVKRSGHPVAEYLHHHAQIGETFQISNGLGDVFYDRRIGDEIVLVAGGIGVTPLLSMFRVVRDQWQDCRAHLVYSASSVEEFAFGSEIRDAVAAHPHRLKASFVLSTPNEVSTPDWVTHRGRLNAESLKALDLPQLAHYFLCGPQAMVMQCETVFRTAGVLPACIHYERW